MTLSHHNKAYSITVKPRKKELENSIPMKSTFVLKLFSKEQVHTCNNPSQNLSEQSVMSKLHHYSFNLCSIRQIKVWVRIHTERTKTFTDF